jgi:T5SS/PEP-CTERM-associated repeat protein
MPRRILLCLTLLASLSVASPAQAVDYFWQNSLGGSFLEPSNWTPLVPAGPGGVNDTVNFDLGFVTSRYTITDVAGESDQLLVHDDTLELNIFPDYTLVNAGGANPSFIVGAASGDDGDVILSGSPDSVLTTQVSSLGNVAGSTGIVYARLLEWNSSGNLRVGHAGTGILNIEDDATLSNTNVFIGNMPGSIGRVDVGPDATWTTSGNLFVGREGEGTLTIDTRSSVTTANASIGVDSTGDGWAFISGTSVTWTITNSLTVGESGEGMLIIGNAGNVNNDNAFVGRLAGSDGRVLATEGIWTTTGRLSIGGDADTGVGGGEGLVEILDGADVIVEEDIVIFSNGALTLDVNSATGSFGSLSSAIITVESGGEFDWLRGNLLVDEFNGSLRNQGGVLATRPNSDTITINGSYLQEASGTLSIEIAGAAATNQFDSLIVTDTAYLGGELEIYLVDLFEPGPHEEYIILDATDFGVGSFSNVANGERLSDMNGIGSFVVHYGMGSLFDPHQVVLTDFQPVGLLGDYNQDGVVDAADYVVWRKTDASQASYDLWRANFGATAVNAATRAAHTPPAARAAVPEPSTLVFASGGFAIWMRMRRRRQGFCS